jgi:translation initiation factor IF-3
LGFVEAQPKQDGRNMIMVIGPHRRKNETKAERAEPREGTAAPAERPVRVRRAPAPSAAEREAAEDATSEAQAGA